MDKRRLILWTDKYKRGRDVDVFILRRGKVNKSHWNFLWNMNISRTVQKHTDTQCREVRVCAAGQSLAAHKPSIVRITGPQQTYIVHGAAQGLTLNHEER